MTYLFKVLHNTVRFSHSWIKPDGYETGIYVYNCITRTKVPLILQNKNLATWYTCGPTVYDASHIGHASCYVKLDIIQRILRKYFNIKLLTVMNVTDVDDKIIKRSRELKISEAALTQQYEKEFFNDLNLLNVEKPNIILRVTECMPEIQGFIQKLIDKKLAYIDKYGSVNFDIKASNFYYGKLQNIRRKDGSSEADESNIKDFTIWKAAKENEPYWNASFGPGRPGWHTECSALAGAIFGSSIDIHAGGIDLRFPHHENEEAQCCAFFSKPQWVNYWFHTGHLLHSYTKMSKSLKNTTSIIEMLRLCDSDTFRIMCLMSHYRSNMEFSQEYVNNAAGLLKSYKNFIADCNACLSRKFNPQINGDILSQSLMDATNRMHAALTDDFDTDLCIKVVNSLVTTVNKMLNISASSNNVELRDLSTLASVLSFVVNTFETFGIHLDQSRPLLHDTDHSTEITNILTQYRQNVRARALECKDLELLNLSDDVRNALKNVGIIIKDHGKLSSWSKA